jgi:hypothetical protein
MAARTYRVRIARGDQQFEAEGDKAFVLGMLKKFEDDASRTLAASGKEKSNVLKPSQVSPAALASAKSMSPGEFVREFGFKKHTDLVLAFGYYLEQHSGLKAFTASDINNCYYEAKMEASNVSQSIIQNIKRRFMMEARAPRGEASKQKSVKKYTLTATGEAYMRKAAASVKHLE